jgi:hypothetical protein
MRHDSLPKQSVMRIDNKPETKEEPRTGETRSGLFGPPMGHNLFRPFLFTQGFARHPI